MFLEILLGKLAGNLAWEPVPGNLFLQTLAWEPPENIASEPLFLGTLAWEPLAGNPCLGTLAREPVPGNLAWNLLGTLPGNLFLGTSCWEPLLGNLFLATLPGNLAWEPCWETLPGNLAWEPCLGTLLGNLFLEPLLGDLFLGTLLGNLFLGTLLGNLAWEPLPGNLAWEPLPGNPVPNLAPCGFGCSEGFSWKRKPFLGTRSQPCAVRIWLLPPAPEPLLWLKTPSLRRTTNPYKRFG